MPLVDTAAILNDARKHRYAIGAFNIENIDMAIAVIQAAEALRRPVILQTTYTTLRHTSARAYAGLISALASDSAAEICLHLDHGNTLDICKSAVDAGYSSVMIDGSSLRLQENIDLTLNVVKYAKERNKSVEGELGKVGGTEDEVSAEASYTDVLECMEFVLKTGVDFVAIGVGTAHGIYQGEPIINTALISKIYNSVSVPLVLHGASGLNAGILRECIASGISKINFATEMRMAYTRGIREKLIDLSVYDPKAYQPAGRKAVYEEAYHKLELIG